MNLPLRYTLLLNAECKEKGRRIIKIQPSILYANCIIPECADEGYKAIKDIKEFSSEKCFRNFFSAFDNDGMHIGELGAISDEVVKLRSQTESPMEV